MKRISQLLQNHTFEAVSEILQQEFPGIRGIYCMLKEIGNSAKHMCSEEELGSVSDNDKIVRSSVTHF